MMRHVVNFAFSNLEKIDLSIVNLTFANLHRLSPQTTLPSR